MSEQKNNKIKKSFASARFQSGAYSSLLTLIAIALVIVVNLFFHQWDQSFDLSEKSLFTLSKETKKALKQVKDDVTIYYMVQPGKEDERIYRVLKQYNKLSGHIKMVEKDPVVYPGFASQYIGDDQEIADDDVIVVNESNQAAKYIASNEMYYTQSMSYYGGSDEEYLDVEGRVTSAIQSVSSGDAKKVCLVTGHKEQQFDEELQDSLEKMNLKMETISLATSGKVPEDCALLVLYGISSDLRNSEKEVLLKYLKQGGNVMVLLNYIEEDTPNLDQVLQEYGIGVQKGMIYEGPGYYEKYNNWIVPNINNDAEIMSRFEKLDYVFMAYAESLTNRKQSEKKASLEITDLLTTSKQALLKTNRNSKTMKKERGDLDGPFVVGKYVTEAVDQGTARMTVLSTCYVQDAMMEKMISGLMKAAGGVDMVSASAKSLSYSRVTIPVAGQLFWSVTLVFFVPLVLLITGFVIWFTRRRK